MVEADVRLLWIEPELQLEHGRLGDRRAPSVGDSDQKAGHQECAGEHADRDLPTHSNLPTLGSPGENQLQRRVKGGSGAPLYRSLQRFSSAASDAGPRG